jgi:hypothetical protein
VDFHSWRNAFARVIAQASNAAMSIACIEDFARFLGISRCNALWLLLSKNQLVTNKFCKAVALSQVITAWNYSMECSCHGGRNVGIEMLNLVPKEGLSVVKEANSHEARRLHWENLRFWYVCLCQGSRDNPTPLNCCFVCTKNRKYWSSSGSGGRMDFGDQW